MSNLVDICVPIFNEESNLTILVADFQRVKKEVKNVGKLVLLDNGSSDGTKSLMKSLTDENIVQVHLRENIGYGGGAWAAINASSNPFVALIPANNQYPLERIVELIDVFCSIPTEERNRLLVKGRRVQRKDPFSIRLLSNAYSILMSLFIGRFVRDINGLPKIFNKQILSDYLGVLPENASFDAVLIYELTRRGTTIMEFPISYNKRKNGQASWTHNRLKISRKMAITFIRHRFSR